MDYYVVVTWPDIQALMDEPGFRKNSSLINDDIGLETYGSSAYYVDKEWLESVGKDIKKVPQEGDEVNLSLPFTYYIGDENPITGDVLETVDDCIQAVRDELREDFDWLNCNIEVV